MPSSYVDDMKMAGEVQNCAIMWDRLSKKLDIDPPAPAGTNTYIGVKQSNVELNDDVKKIIKDAQRNVRLMLKM